MSERSERRWLSAAASDPAERREADLRPMRLDMAGFTVFRDETTVDFTDADYFALVGPTGSGKSTVLDAITLRALRHGPALGRRPRHRQRARPVAPPRPGCGWSSSRPATGTSPPGWCGGTAGATSRPPGPGLQLMPAGFDVTKLDTGMDLDDLGEVLAGTPAEMDEAMPARGRPAVRAVHQLRGAAAGPVRRLPARQAGRSGSRSWSTCSACTSTSGCRPSPPAGPPPPRPSSPWSTSNWPAWPTRPTRRSRRPPSIWPGCAS